MPLLILVTSLLLPSSPVKSNAPPSGTDHTCPAAFPIKCSGSGKCELAAAGCPDNADFKCPPTMLDGDACGANLCCSTEKKLTCSGGYCRPQNAPPQVPPKTAPPPPKCGCASFLNKFMNYYGWSCREAWEASPSCTVQCLSDKDDHCPMYVSSSVVLKQQTT